MHRLPAIVLLLLLVSACGGAPAAISSLKATATAPVPPSASAAAPASSANKWSETVSTTSIPLGDGKVATSPEAGFVDSCVTSFRGGGAQHSGAWLNSAAGTWNSQAKPAVSGARTWPQAVNSFALNGSYRIVNSNDLPQGLPTGDFPIATSDSAYAYDHNPNSITPQAVNYTLTANPVAAASPHCLGLGAIGILTDGVLLFNALDAGGRDAGAHEIQDQCGGHPQMNGMYHLHTISTCLLNRARAASGLVGYALDGYGIYAEYDSAGNLPGNADLDACHGRISTVEWDGKPVSMYHYDVTLEYPYTLGCFHGTPVASPPPH